MRKSAYRKIYEAHHGPIPKDTQGRSFEIHHINSDHNDNRIENLKLVTIEEHYAIHKAQGDYVSAFMIAQRMKLSPAELSDIASKSVTMTNARRIKDGTHHFQDGEAARQRNLTRVTAGTHNFLSEDNPSTVLAKAGKHHFQLNNPVNNLLAKGTHASKIKLSCIFCHRQCSKNNFNKEHKNCGVKILPVAL
jgi:hypothetical protein